MTTQPSRPVIPILPVPATGPVDLSFLSMYEKQADIYPSRGGVVYAPAPMQQQMPPPVYSQYPGEGYVVAPSAPPPMYQEAIPVRPFADALWIAGFWGWMGGRYVWNAGRWDHPRQGHQWEPHRWVPHGNGQWRNCWVWARPCWT